MANWTTNNIPDQTGRTAIVTGANSGLGYITALELAQKGAHVVMACRNMQKGEKAQRDILAQVPDASLELVNLDLSSLDSVRTFADWFTSTHDTLHLLINNAGVMAIPRRETADGFEMQFGTNHLGHFALTGLLLDHLANTPGSRVVTVTSVAHASGKIHFDDLQMKDNYSRYGAYGQSKLANVLFGFELQRRFDAMGIDSASIVAHPGYSATNLQHTSASSSGSSLEERLYALSNRLFAQSAEMGTLPQLYAATAPDVRGGDFIGPRRGVSGYPEKRTARRLAYDENLAARLWEASEHLTGVRYALPQRV